jgi:hypothetical protein
LGQHANNDTARAFIRNSAFFHRALVATRCAYWMILPLLLPPVLWWWWQHKNKRQQLRTGN